MTSHIIFERLTPRRMHMHSKGIRKWREVRWYSLALLLSRACVAMKTHKMAAIKKLEYKLVVYCPDYQTDSERNSQDLQRSCSDLLGSKIKVSHFLSWSYTRPTLSEMPFSNLHYNESYRICFQPPQWRQLSCIEFTSARWTWNVSQQPGKAALFTVEQHHSMSSTRKETCCNCLLSGGVDDHTNGQDGTHKYHGCQTQECNLRQRHRVGIVTDSQPSQFLDLETTKKLLYFISLLLQSPVKKNKLCTG